ncbi:MAG: hypothetical protein ACYTF0_09215, partial [Planctomycetota bacterium]
MSVGSLMASEAEQVLVAVAAADHALSTAASEGQDWAVERLRWQAQLDALADRIAQAQSQQDA